LLPPVRRNFVKMAAASRRWSGGVRTHDAGSGSAPASARIRYASSSIPPYRVQAERWLECLVRNDVTRVDGVLDSRFVYAQVFAGSGAEHGIIDVLTITRTGRHAVLELRASEHIHLSLQAAHYWLRVRRHLELGEFRSYGRVWNFKTCRHWFSWSLPPCVSIR